MYVSVTPEWSRNRLKERHRNDDKTEDEIDRKIAWFNNDVLPAIEYFKGDPFYKYIEVDGQQSREKVHEDILSHLTW